MTEYQRLFLVQARTDLAVFQLLWQDLQETAAGRQFLNLTGGLFAMADAFL